MISSLYISLSLDRVIFNILPTSCIAICCIPSGEQVSGFSYNKCFGSIDAQQYSFENYITTV